MFEGQPQTEVEALMKGSNEFRQLYQRHKELDKQGLDAELGVLPIDDATGLATGIVILIWAAALLPAALAPALLMPERLGWFYLAIASRRSPIEESRRPASRLPQARCRKRDC